MTIKERLKKLKASLTYMSCHNTGSDWYRGQLAAEVRLLEEQLEANLPEPDLIKEIQEWLQTEARDIKTFHGRPWDSRIQKIVEFADRLRPKVYRIIWEDSTGGSLFEQIPDLYQNAKRTPEQDLARAKQGIETWMEDRTRDKLIAECEDRGSEWPVSFDGEKFTLFVGSSVAPELDQWIKFQVEEIAQ